MTRKLQSLPRSSRRLRPPEKGAAANDDSALGLFQLQFACELESELTSLNARRSTS